VGDLAQRFPGIIEMIAAVKDGEGKSRRPATLMILFDDGLIKLCMNDRHWEVSAWVSGRNLDAALQALEDGLQADKLEWRKNKVFRPGGKRP
jgi:hypothetical protein